MRPFDKHIPGLTDDGDGWNWFTNNGAPGDPGAGDASPALVDPGDSSFRRGTPHPFPRSPTPVPPAPVNVPTLPASPTAFTINVHWDSSVAAAPAGFTSDIVAVVQYLESRFDDPVTLNINVGYNEVGGDGLGGGALGESLTNLTSVSYASLLGAVTADAKTAADQSVVASLPATSPASRATYWVSTAQAKALGLAAGNGTGSDGSVGFGSAAEFTFGDTANSGTVASGTYDFFATAVHEITEVMGRQLLTGGNFGGNGNSDTLLDLLHYSAPGTRDFAASTQGYFSVDGGTTNQGAFNTVSGGDAGDWASSVTNDPFDAFATQGVLSTVSANDLTEMDAIGWDAASGLTPVTPPVTLPVTPPVTPPVSPPVTPPPVVSAGVAFAPETRFLAHDQGRTGLSGFSPLATVTQTGGTAGDTFTYALSGAGAASFGLVPTGDGGAVLTTALNGVAGAAGGKLYPMAVTAADQTATGNPSATSDLNVAIGDNASNAVDLASLTGIVAAAPTFIYGLGGNDTLDGTGMTGGLFFDGGAGADTMTGGTGQNVYEYGGSVDSTASAMDIITNFNVAVDLIDLTGLNRGIATAAALDPSATTIAAGAIGWQASGGDTFVYVNTSYRSEALTRADMKIELQGGIALTGGNFAHA